MKEDLRVFKVFQDLKVIQAILVLLENKVLSDQKVQKAHKDQSVQ